jgi:hypothetical protein
VLAGGEMLDRVRDFDWSTSKLGPRETWSASLKLASQIVLASGFPMALRWGPDCVLIYNDAYIRGPRPALGRDVVRGLGVVAAHA